MLVSNFTKAVFSMAMCVSGSLSLSNIFFMQILKLAADGSLARLAAASETRSSVLTEPRAMKSKEQGERELNEADQAYYNFRNQLNEKESELRHKIRNREQVEHLLGEIKDRLNDLKLQLAGTRERLNVEFKIQLEDILDQQRTGDDGCSEQKRTSSCSARSRTL